MASLVKRCDKQNHSNCSGCRQWTYVTSRPHQAAKPRTAVSNRKGRCGTSPTRDAFFARREGAVTWQQGSRDYRRVPSPSQNKTWFLFLFWSCSSSSLAFLPSCFWFIFCGLSARALVFVSFLFVLEGRMERLLQNKTKLVESRVQCRITTKKPCSGSTWKILTRNSICSKTNPEKRPPIQGIVNAGCV